MPQRERYLWVCQNERPADHPKGSCAGLGSERVLKLLKAGVVKRGLRHRVRVCGSSCLDVCWKGVAVAVMPDQVFYGGVHVADVDAILDGLEEGSCIERLMLDGTDFDDPRGPLPQGPEVKGPAATNPATKDPATKGVEAKGPGTKSRV